MKKEISHFRIFRRKGIRVYWGMLFFLLVSIPSTLICQTYQDSIQEIARNKLAKRKALEQTLSRARQQNNVSLEMELLDKLFGFISNDFGDLSSSYVYARDLEKLFQLHPDMELVTKLSPGLYHNIGWYLSTQGKLEESIAYFHKSMAADQSSHSGQFFDNMNQLASSYIKMEKNDKAKEVFISLADSLLKYPKDDPDSRFIELRYYKVIRDLKLMDKDYRNGLEYAKKSIDSIEGYGVTSDNYRVLAEYYSHLNELDSAKIAAEISLDIAQSQMFNLEERNAHRFLYSLYEKEQDYKKALSHFKQLAEINNEILSFKNALKIGAYDVNSERNKANLDRAISTAKLKNQRLIIWIVSVASILLIVTLFYLFHSVKLIKKKNKIIAKEKLRAEESERFKEQFLANMSHEIRTPMHAISGMINALKRREFSEEQGAYLNVMKLSVDNLLEILNDILDLSKIESGRLQLVSVQMNVKDIVNNVIHLFGTKAEEKGITLKVNVSAYFPDKLLGDPIRLNQILVNLIGNAIKFTEKGGVVVTLRKKTEHYSLEIQDSGMGIPKSSLQSIFEAFKQGEEGLNKGYLGSGLGLSITKQLVELQGGRIWAESELGKGSTFFVELPLIESTPEQAKLNYEDEELLEIGKSLSGLKILIAEDNEFNVMVLEDDLKWSIPNVKLTVVENGALAVRKFKEGNYDLILMDVQMPELDGYEATRIIRNLESQQKASKTPIIAMTAGIIKNQVERCLGAGMDSYILKPYHPKKLIEGIAKVLR